jgi:hypothetical protein
MAISKYDEAKAITDRVAPIVEKSTGYELALDGMKLSVVSDGNLYQILHQRGLNFPTSNRFLRPLQMRLGQLALNTGVLAIYDFVNGEMLINDPGGSNNPNLPPNIHSTTAHELVHRGQHVSYPEYFVYFKNRSDQLISGNHPPKEKKARQREIQLLSTFMEDDAYAQTWKIIPELPVEKDDLLSRLKGTLTYPLVWQELALMAKWSQKRLSPAEKKLIFENPEKIMHCFRAWLAPSGLPEYRSRFAN